MEFQKRKKIAAYLIAVLVFFVPDLVWLIYTKMLFFFKYEPYYASHYYMLKVFSFWLSACIIYGYYNYRRKR